MTDSARAARETARKAPDTLPDNDSLGGVLVFSERRHNQKDHIHGMRSQFGMAVEDAS
jgi:hypothetical protein